MLKLGLLLILLLKPVWADDVTDSIDEARKAWVAGKAEEAMQSLDYASQLIRQKKGERLELALPEALAGWKKTDSGSSAAGSSLFGGATAANASFERQQGEEYSSCSVSIATDNPMMGMLLASFSNPMLMSGSGKKLIKVGGQKASIEYDEADKSGNINVVVAQQVLVTVQGSGLSAEELKAYADAVKYDVIEKVLQGQP